MLAVKVDIETAPCYDETSFEKGRGLGTLTTLKPTLNRPTFLGQPISHRFDPTFLAEPALPIPPTPGPHGSGFLRPGEPGRFGVRSQEQRHQTRRLGGSISARLHS